MTSFSVQITNTNEDFKAWYKLVYQKNINKFKQKTLFFTFLPLVLVILIGTIGFIATPSIHGSDFLTALIVYLISAIIFLIPMGLLTLLFNLYLRWIWLLKGLSVAKKRGFMDTQTIVFSSDEIETSNGEIKASIKYSFIKNLYETSSHLFLVVASGSAFVLPKSEFATEQIDFIRLKVN